MKKYFLLLFVLFVFINAGISQSRFSKIDLVKPVISKIFKNINSIDINSLDDEVKLCQEYWELSYTNDSLELEEESRITISKLEDERYLYKIETDFIDEEDGDFTRVIKAYFRENSAQFEEKNIDSAVVFILRDQLKIPYLNLINTYNNGGIIKSTSYYNWDFDFPPKFELEDSTNYFYDDNDNLEIKTSFSIYSSEIGVAIVDSIVYSNNNVKNRPHQTVEYRINYDSDKLERVNRKTYNYDNEGRLIKVKTFDGHVLLELVGYETIDYKENIRVKLNKLTHDQGKTWYEQYKDSTIFINVLDVSIPRTVIHLAFKNDVWVVDELRETHYCDAHAAVKDIDELMFDAYFNDNEVVIDSKDNLTDVNVKLYNINGQVLFNKNYSILPERFQVNNLISGVYFLRVVNNKNEGITKLTKFQN